MSQKQTNTRTLIGLATIALAIGSLLLTVPSLASAIFASSLNSQSGQDNLNALLTSHEEDLDTYLNRFEGRSLFFRPSPYAVKAKNIKPKTETKTVDPKQSGPPSTYIGPKVTGVYGNEVWFKDNLKILIGEENDGVTVLQINAPWTVKLAHKGGEYDVSIFSDRLTNSDEFSNPLKLKSMPGIIYDDDPADSEDAGDAEDSGDKVKRERVQQ